MVSGIPQSAQHAQLRFDLFTMVSAQTASTSQRAPVPGNNNRGLARGFRFNNKETAYQQSPLDSSPENPRWSALPNVMFPQVSAACNPMGAAVKV